VVCKLKINGEGKSQQFLTGIISDTMPAGKSIENISGLLIFQIGDKEFCVDLKLITAIMKPGEIKTERRGKKLTSEFSEQQYRIIDFAAFYSLYLNNISDSSRVLFLEIYGQKVSFYVDKVMEIISLDKIFIEESVQMVHEQRIDYVGYVMGIQDRKYYFPDFDRIAKEIRSSISVI